MTLLILDDEWYAVKGISQGIDWSPVGIDTVLEAFNAADALELLEQQPVDVILCDIEMAEMNGLEFARICAERQYAAKIIFLTGHADFSYANEAVRLKAFDYVLKPVDHQILRETVRKALEQAQMDGEKENAAEKWREYQSRLEAQRPERTRLFWRNVIDNRLGRESIRSWLGLQEAPQEMPTLVTPAAVWMDDGGGTTQEENVLSFVLGEKLEEMLLSKYEGCLLPDPELESVLLIYGTPLGLENCLGKICQQLSEELGRQVSFRLGEAAAPETLWWAVRCLRTGVLHTFAGEDSQPERMDWEEALTTQTAEQAHAQADQVFGEIAASARKLRFQAEVQRLRGAMLSLADRYHFSQETVQMILALQDTQELTEEFLNHLHQVMDVCFAEIHACPRSDNALITRCEQYIRAHLAQELSRETLAAQIYLHPAYLSRLFKRETGVTLSDYIASERIKAACRLLEDPAIKIGAVAGQVGIPQFSYFCRVFRRIMGMSPQEYRQTHRAI